jgi:hypothetical protein
LTETAPHQRLDFDPASGKVAVAGSEEAMTDTLTFYTNPMSRGRIARWMLEEVGEPYETVLLDYGTTMKAPDYLAINPMGKVPAIKHNDTVVTEQRRFAPTWRICFRTRDLPRRPGTS